MRKVKAGYVVAASLTNPRTIRIGPGSRKYCSPGKVAACPTCLCSVGMAQKVAVGEHRGSALPLSQTKITEIFNLNLN